jgi:hypothetical protein
MRKHFVRILPSAKKDTYEARKWYRQYNEELSVRFKEELRLTVEALKLRPPVHAIRYKHVRFAQLPTFPYAVHYFIDEVAFTVNIIAVVHTAINPLRWRVP